METGKAIYKLLKDSSAVGAICADRIYPELAQQDADAPFVVYTVVDTTPSDTKTSTSKVDTARVELYCVGDDYETVMDLGIAVRGALDRQSGTISGVQVQSISFDASDIQFDSDQRVYVLEQTYNTRVQRTGSYDHRLMLGDIRLKLVAHHCLEIGHGSGQPGLNIGPG